METRFKYLALTHGEMKVAGSGLSVFNVLGSYSTGDKPEDIASAYEIPLAAVFEALAYACENADEMAATRTRNEQALSELKAEWNGRLGGRLDELLRGSPVS